VRITDAESGNNLKVGGRGRVTTDEERLLRLCEGVNKGQVLKIGRLRGSKNFADKRESLF